MTESGDTRLAEFISLMPFSQQVGMTLEAAEPAEVVGVLRWAAELCTSGGILHGGFLMAFADSLGAICAILNLPEGAGTATIESKTNFFRGVPGGVVRGTTSPLHIGRSTIVVQSDLRNEAGKRVALVTQTQAVIHPKS